MKKRVLSLLLALALLLTALPQYLTPARAEDAPVYSGECGAQGGNLTWRFDPDTGLLSLSGTGAMTDYHVYNRVFPPWYDFRESITAVSLPEGLTCLGQCAFSDCSALSSVKLPDSLTEIRGGAFQYCSALSSVAVPGSVTLIGPSAFLSCSALSSVTLPDNLAELSGSAFQFCTALRSFSFPQQLKSIGPFAFSGCTGLSSVTLPESLTQISYEAFDGCSKLTELVIHNPGCAIYNRSNTLGSPETTVLYGYTPSTALDYANQHSYRFVSLGDLPLSGECGAQGDNLTWSFDPASGVLSIQGSGEMAEYDTANLYPWYPYRNQITALSLQEGISSISKSAFRDIPGLTELTVPEGVTTIGLCAFYRCSGLRSVTLPESLSSVDSHAFAECGKLNSLTAHCFLCSIGPYADTLGNPASTVLYGYSGSSMEEYAELTGYAFVSIGGKTFSGECGIGGNNLTWTLDTLTGLVSIEGSGAMQNYGYGTDDPGWKKYRTAIKALSLAEGVTSVGSFAFHDCTRLRSISLPTSVRTIGSQAFYSCYDLKTINFSEGLEKIGSISFGHCGSLQSLVLPEGVRTIDYRAFHECNFLSTVSLPESVENVYYDAFSGCTALRSMTIESYIAFYQNGNTPGNTLGVPGTTVIRARPGSTAQEYAEQYGYSFESLGGRVYSGVFGLEGDNLSWSLDIETGLMRIEGSGGMKDFSSTSVSPWYAYRKYITGIIVGEGVTNIGARAFSDCEALVSADLPESLRLLGTYAFMNCVNLKQIVLPEGLDLIHYSVFKGCSALRSVTIYSEDCQIYSTETTLGNPESTTIYGYGGSTAQQYAQYYGYDFVEIHRLISGECGAQGDNLTWTLNLNTNTLTIQGSGDMADYEEETVPWLEYREAIRTLSLPEGITGIGSHAFSTCAELTAPEFPEGLQRLGDFAFFCCTGLSELRLPASLRSIGVSAFDGCSGLTALSLPEGVLRLGDRSFFGCEGLTELTLPGSIAEIGANCFTYCTALQRVRLQEGIPYVGESMFSGCTALQAVEIPGSAAEIHSYAFNGCRSLTEVLLPEGVNAVGSRAFSFCMGLERITLPESLQSLGDRALNVCDHLQTLWIPDGVTEIGEALCWGCDSLRSVRLPTGLETIPAQAFAFCPQLETVNFPEGLTSIGAEAFLESGLRPVSLPASLLRIDEDAFRNCRNLSALIFQNDSCLVCGLTVDPEEPDEAKQREERPDTLGGSYKTYLFLRQSNHPDGGAARVIQRKYSSLTQYAADYGYHLCPLDSFRDVSPSAYYAVPVAWAVENGITTGAGSGSFRPKQVCTREQVVTFLWKAAGSPKPTSSQSPFSDVKPGKYYYSAVLWAVERGITSGATAASFGVGKPCTREQVVSFLWKALDSPAPAGTESPFTDVKPGKYYFNPVLWAVEHGITSGATPTTFGVGRPCTRAQVVTFLYNAYVLNG